MRNGQNTTNKNNNKTIATIAHDGAFVAIAVQIGITTCSLSNAYDSYRHRLLSPPETGVVPRRGRGWINHPPHTNINPQTLAITGVPADSIIT